ncbi:MAG: PAS domain S-box protein [Rhodocyclales bacterium]|nr:PAS domain S-box protein [Rhodocyclales bacterium]
MQPVGLSRYLLSRAIFAALATILVAYPLVTGWLIPTAQHEVQMRQMQLARAIAGQIGALLKGPEFAITQVRRSLTDEPPRDGDELDAALAGHLQHGESFSALYVTDSAGIIIASAHFPTLAPGAPDMKGHDLSADPLWQLAAQSSGLHWADTLHMAADSDHGVAVATRSGTRVVIGELSMAAVMTRLREVGNEGDLRTLVLDSTGNTLVDSRATRAAHPLPADLALPTSGEPSRAHTVHFVLDNDEMVGAMATLPHTAWRVLVMQPASEAYRPTRTATTIMVLGLLTAVTLGLLGAVFQARGFGRQFRTLRAFAQQVAHGNYELKWPLARVRELNSLATAFETMSHAIRQREAGIANSEARLRAMLDASTGLSIKWLDRSGHIVYWNPGSEHMYGYSAAEALGRKLDALTWAPGQDVSLADLLQRLDQIGGTLGPIEIAVINRADQPGHVLTTLFALPDDGGERMLVSIDVDITDRIRQMRARAEAERKFGVVFEACPVAMEVAVIATDHAAMNVNDAWVKLFCIPRETAIGLNGIEMRMWTNNQVRRKFMDLLDTTEGVSDQEAWMRRSDGEQRLCLVSGKQFVHGGERLAVIVYEDITLQRETQEHLRELNEALESRVAERTSELSGALKHLQLTQDELLRAEKMAALGSLVAGVAHELSTPLGNSLMAANTVADQARAMRRSVEQGLKRSTLDTFLAEAETGSAIIERNLQRAAELVASFKQIAVDQSSSQRRRFDLAAVIDEIVMTMRPSFKRQPYRLDTTIAGNLVLDSYPGPLGQVLSNLISNALIHGLDGRERGYIRITGQADGDDHVVIEVSDDGNGIAEDAQRRIFDPFYTTRLGRGGSGLGLNIVHNLVTHVLGGAITVISAPGVGTTMRVRIPRAAPERDTNGTDTAPNTPPEPPPEPRLEAPTDGLNSVGDGI